MTFDEKVSLIDELWSSMDCSEIGLSVDSAYDRMLERRLAQCDEELDVLITLDRASQQLRRMLNMVAPVPVGASSAA